MLFGRLMGRTLLVLALLMASGEAVMALTLGDRHPGILTGDLLVLLLGHQPHVGLVPLFDRLLAGLPAWALIGPAGLGLILACRRRHRRRLFY